MSKEQTPIENLKEWLNEVTFEGKIMVRDMFIIEQLYKFFDDEEEYRKQYAQAKVLEALENVKCKAEELKEDAEQKIFKSEEYRLLKNTHSFYIDYIETEVKPKYQNKDECRE